MEVKEVVDHHGVVIYSLSYMYDFFLGDKKLFKGYAVGLVQWQSIVTRFNA